MIGAGAMCSCLSLLRKLCVLELDSRTLGNLGPFFIFNFYIYYIMMLEDFSVFHLETSIKIIICSELHRYKKLMQEWLLFISNKIYAVGVSHLDIIDVAKQYRDAV